MKRKARDIRAAIKSKEISRRLGNCLINEGFNTDIDVCAAIGGGGGMFPTIEHFKKIPNLGDRTFRELEKWIGPDRLIERNPEIELRLIENRLNNIEKCLSSIIRAFKSLERAL